MAVTNPIRLVHMAIWTMLDANADLAALVLPSNKIRFTGTVRAPDKDTVSAADEPLLRVIATAMKPHLQRTSSSSTLLLRWEVQITSGDQRFQTYMDVAWEVYKAMVDWESVMKVLEFAGERFVTMSRPLVTRDTMGNEKLNRGILGWSSVWTGETALHFTTSDL